MLPRVAAGVLVPSLGVVLQVLDELLSVAAVVDQADRDLLLEEK